MLGKLVHLLNETPLAARLGRETGERQMPENASGIEEVSI